MNEDLREKMARAICDSNADIPWDRLKEGAEPIYADYLADYYKNADAALSVMREVLSPTARRMCELSNAGWAATHNDPAFEGLDSLDFLEGVLAEIRREAGLE